MIASACDQIVASPATITGSIGVLAGALDASGFLKQQKVQVASVYEGSPPVSASALLCMHHMHACVHACDACVQCL